jgi:hypothetical protein
MQNNRVADGAYRQSDIEVVFNRGQWHSWNDAIHWLEQNGMQDNELKPIEVSSMLQDLRALAGQGIPFSNDPAQVFNELSKFRSS